jgi:hypothetical protein
MVKITFFNTYWPLNIGNAFVDLGSMQSINQALGERCVIYITSNYPIRLFIDKFSTPLGRIMDKIYRNPKTKKIDQKLTYIGTKTLKKDNLLKKEEKLEYYCLDLGKLIRADYAVLSGMVLWDSFIKLHKSTLLTLKKRSVKIILNGVGGPFYSETEVAFVRLFLKEVRPYALISRDEKAFKYYGDLAEHSYSGIDCAFFVNNHYQPPKLDAPEYVVICFDKLLEPKVNLAHKLVIHVHHHRHTETYRMPKEYFLKPNTLVSDSPYDYLTLYANASATYSDRVHACVVTLSYGHPAKLFTGSDAEILSRMLLFRKIGADSITNRLTYPDTKKIEKEKEEQIRFLREVLARV